MKALISVTDKTGIVDFAKGIQSLGYDIVSTGGTAKVLNEAGVSVVPIEEVTGFPEMLNGRVKTLHPKIHGGLLALRDNSMHMETANSHGIGMIDLVVVNLYEFEKTIANKTVVHEDAVENIDIGGPSMIRSAAKNYQSVSVVVDPEDYSPVLAEMNQNSGKLSAKTNAYLAGKAYRVTAKYDTAIANYFQSYNSPNDTFGDVFHQSYEKVADLRYGENPHQQSAVYRDASHSGILSAEQLHGKPLSYNNYMDTDAAWQIAKSFQAPAVAVIKHANPCGFAIKDTILDAYRAAYEADPVSAFGSIIALNREVDAGTAEELSKLFVEVIIAPDYTPEALGILQRKPSLRLLKLSVFYQDSEVPQIRQLQGGILLQDPDNWMVDPDGMTTATSRDPSPVEKQDLEVAFKLVKFVKSNAIVVVKNGVSIGIGAGQMSRIDSVNIALEKAGKNAQGAVVGSDAFFPFRDSVDLMAKSGISAVIQPGGSKRDDESIDACNQHGMAMMLTGHRHFRH